MDDNDDNESVHAPPVDENELRLRPHSPAPPPLDTVLPTPRGEAAVLATARGAASNLADNLQGLRARLLAGTSLYTSLQAASPSPAAADLTDSQQELAANLLNQRQAYLASRQPRLELDVTTIAGMQRDGEAPPADSSEDDGTDDHLAEHVASPAHRPSSPPPVDRRGSTASAAARPASPVYIARSDPTASPDVRITLRFRGGAKRQPADWKFPDDESLHTPPPHSEQKTFHRVFPSAAQQEDVYDGVVRPLVDAVVQGYHATVFCYGQTGSGKTHSMFGSDDQPGMFPRAIQDLFEQLEAKKASESITYMLNCTFVETVSKKFEDLLGDGGGKEEKKSAKAFLKDNRKHNGTIVAARSAEDVIRMMRRGLARRTTAATKMNAESSRTHAIFTVEVAHFAFSGTKKKRVCSTFNFVDLAGSERIKRSGAEGGVAKQAMCINRDLSFLNDVVRVLVEKDKQYKPVYRNCNLTWFLQDALGGNAKTSFVITLSPEQADVTESMHTLDFAQRALKLPNKATLQEIHAGEISDTDKEKWAALEGENTELRRMHAELQVEAERKIKEAKAAEIEAVERAKLKEENINKLQSEVSQLKNLHDSQKDRITHLTEMKAKDDNERRRLHEQMTSLLKDAEQQKYDAEIALTNMRGQLSQRDAELRMVTQERQKVEQEQTRLLVKHKALEEQYKMAQADRTEMEERIITFQEQAMRAMAELQRVEREYCLFKLEADRFLNEKENVERELRLREALLDNANKELAMSKDELRHTRDELSSTIREKAGLREEIRLMQDENQALRNENSELKIKSKQADILLEDNAAVRREMEQLYDTIKVLNSRIVSVDHEKEEKERQERQAREAREREEREARLREEKDRWEAEKQQRNARWEQQEAERLAREEQARKAREEAKKRRADPRNWVHPGAYEKLFEGGSLFGQSCVWSCCKSFDAAARGCVFRGSVAEFGDRPGSGSRATNAAQVQPEQHAPQHSPQQQQPERSMSRSGSQERPVSRSHDQDRGASRSGSHEFSSSAQPIPPYNNKQSPVPPIKQLRPPSGGDNESEASFAPSLMSSISGSVKAQKREYSETTAKYLSSNERVPTYMRQTSQSKQRVASPPKTRTKSPPSQPVKRMAF